MGKKSLRDQLGGRLPRLEELSGDQQALFRELARQAAPYEKMSDDELVRRLQQMRRTQGISGTQISAFAQQLMPYLTVAQQQKLRQVLKKL